MSIHPPADERTNWMSTDWPEIPTVLHDPAFETPMPRADGTQYWKAWNASDAKPPAMKQRSSPSARHIRQSSSSISATTPVSGNGMKVSSLIAGKKRLCTTCDDTLERTEAAEGRTASNACTCCRHRTRHTSVLAHTRK